MTDLIERLLAVEGGDEGTHWYRNPDGPEAAARIAELEAENHALKWGPEHIGHAVGRDLLADAQARIAELEAEVARLREPVQVKPLVWEENWSGEDEDIPCWRGCNPLGICVHVSFAGESRLARHADADPERLSAKKAIAQANYDVRVRAALAAPDTGGAADGE